MTKSSYSSRYLEAEVLGRTPEQLVPYSELAAERQNLGRYVPELAGCSSDRIHEPWRMTPAEQRAAGVVVGEQYPAPVVDHAVARQQTLQMFRDKARP